MSAMLRQFSIRTRMIGAIAMVLSLLLVVGGVGLFGMRAMHDLTQAFKEQTIQTSHQMHNLVQSIGDMRRFEKDILIAYQSPDSARAYQQRWDQTLQQFGKAAKDLASHQPETKSLALDKMSALVEGYAGKAAPVFKEIIGGHVDSVGSANKQLESAKADIQAAQQLVDELSKQLDTNTNTALAKAQQTEDRVMTAFIAILLISAVVVIPLTLLNMQSICKPLADAEDLAQAIAAGDLTKTAIEVEGQDEASHLMRSLQNMQHALQTLVGQLRTSADSIRTASVEIATGNQDLSGRTEQTASNLQQAASSMTQLTGTVKQTADSARTANQLANSASGAAAKGGEVVGQVVSTMDEINTSSKKINDIIGVIDGIAFQTNILALNAAVEAARAGEQGRGFAVVASEVRSLAQRSAEAAREIKTLIGASVERVETGSRLVQEAGESMTDIVTSVQRVSDIIGEITAAASEQSDGIAQVNQSVLQLDQMTQQNAALVEESAAAAESLKDQAERLAEAVDKFKINSGSAAGKHSFGGSTVTRPATSVGASSSHAAAKPSLAGNAAPAISKPNFAPAKPARSSATATASSAAKPPRSEPVARSVPVAQAEGDWESF
ncbi:methyl-accepting chemotaxis protein [Paucibacter oligotrophus]|uniref:Methyl-accepting chemotaxis protein n=2 Tax=Roseateles oligotrophus TaxID=1769250 RepID=A0A840L1M2_9BURK|nr:methyl-accepting chemotaxis protein [Roseateles oligotrophus]